MFVPYLLINSQQFNSLSQHHWATRWFWSILVDFFCVISKTYICQSLSFLYIIACRYLIKMNITDNFSLCKTRNRHVTRKICFGRVKRIGDWFISTLTKTFYIKLTLLLVVIINGLLFLEIVVVIPWCWNFGRILFWPAMKQDFGTGINMTSCI